MIRDRDAKQVQVLFLPSGRKGIVEHGTSLLDSAHRLGEGIEAICGGQGVCGKCKVRILENTSHDHGIDSSPSHLSSMTHEEKGSADKHGLRTGERLACQARVEGDLVVRVPEESRLGQPVISKDAGHRTIPVVPSIRKHYLDLQPSTLKDPMGDWERLSAVLKSRFHISRPVIDHKVLQSLWSTLQEGRGEITVTVWQGEEVVRVEPGYCEKAFGLAVDLGTTTIAGYLCDLASGELAATGSMINPQIEFGEDVMTRISSAREDDNRIRLNRLILDALNQLVGDVTRKASLKPEDVCEAVLVGNTAMHHFFLGLDVRSLGQAPFSPAISRSVDVKARDLGFEILPSANVHVLPIEAGFVGADNVAVLISEEPYNQDEVLLIIDIGTNGELILGNRERMLSASCATGPAFEGGCVKFGMRASAGSIDKIRIDPETWEVGFHIIEKADWSHSSNGQGMEARGICGSGVIDAIAEMVHAGVLRRNGSFEKTRVSPRLREGSDGVWEFVVAWADQTAINEDITLTQKDVRAVQLAKAALYAGSEMLLKRMGVERPDKVILAGAFGTEIDPERALAIGLYPDCGLENIRAVGNAAGDGARIALLNREKRAEAERVAREVEYVELTVEPEFMRTFVFATEFPDRTEALSTPMTRGR